MLFRPKKLAVGGGLGNGGKKGRKGPQEGCISQNKLRKKNKIRRKLALRKWQAGGREGVKHLSVLQAPWGQEVNMASLLSHAPGQEQERDQGKL